MNFIATHGHLILDVVTLVCLGAIIVFLPKDERGES